LKSENWKDDEVLFGRNHEV